MEKARRLLVILTSTMYARINRQVTPVAAGREVENADHGDESGSLGGGVEEMNLLFSHGTRPLVHIGWFLTKSFRIGWLLFLPPFLRLVIKYHIFGCFFDPLLCVGGAIIGTWPGWFDEPTINFRKI